jgi:hypothetical protein
VHKFLSFTFATIAFIPYLLSTCIMVILTLSVMTYILVFRGRAAMKEYHRKFMSSPFLAYEQRAKWNILFTLIFWLFVLIVILVS